MRVPAVVVPLALGLLLAACAAPTGVPDREPEVTGVVTAADDPDGPRLAQPSDDYYEGMLILGGDPHVVTSDGGDLDPAELRDGDEVALWVADACAESFPVQCTVEVVQVRG